MLMVKKLSEKAVLPVRSSPSRAVFDFFSAVETKIPGRGSAVVCTDLSVAIPKGSYARIGHEFPREDGIEVQVRVIEEDYRGSVDVTLFNHSDDEFQVKEGCKVAQLILDKVVGLPEVVEVECLDETLVEGWCRKTGVKIDRVAKDMLEKALNEYPEGGTECLKWILLGWNKRGDQNFVDVKKQIEKATEELVSSNQLLGDKFEKQLSQLMSAGDQNFVDVKKQVEKATEELVCSNQLIGDKFEKQLSELISARDQNFVDVKKQVEKATEELVSSNQLLGDKFEKQLSELMSTGDQNFVDVKKQVEKATEELVSSNQLLGDKFEKQLSELMSAVKECRNDIKEIMSRKASSSPPSPFGFSGFASSSSSGFGSGFASSPSSGFVFK